MPRVVFRNKNDPHHGPPQQSPTVALPVGLLRPTGSAPLLINSGSSVFAHGQAFTVTGSSFGTKAAQSPWQFDFFNGTNGVTMNTDPRGWLCHANLPAPVLRNTPVRSTPGRTTSVEIGQTGNDVPGFAFGNNGTNYLSLTASSSGNLRTPPGPSILIDWWMYWAEGGTANNYKWLRWHAATNGARNELWGSPGGLGFTNTTVDGSYNLLTSSLMAGWHHYQHLANWNSPVFHQFKFDNVRYMDTDGSGNYIASPGTPSGVTFGPWAWNIDGDYLSTWMFEMQNDTIASGARNAKAYLCDVLVDNGYGRVEIGNHATYANATHTEIQPYTAWSTGSITFTVNRGTFGPSDSVWIYVIDNTNTLRLTQAATFQG